MPGRELELRREIVATARALAPSGLGVGRSGNVSARHGDGMLITPSGIAYEAISGDEIVHLDADGALRDKGQVPSSEWRFHLAIYQSRPEAGAIVHCHSRFATVLACGHRAIPAFHYMVAVAGGHDIRCAEYALFGSADLSAHVLAALAGRSACLMAHHGQVAFAATLGGALELAGEVEELAAQYCALLKLGEVKLLSDAQMDAVLARFQTYGGNAQT